MNVLPLQFISCGVFLLLTFGIAPLTYAQVSVVSSLAAAQSAQPGTSYQEVIEVRNETNQPQLVRLYQRDYLFLANGSSRYPSPDSLSRSNAGWFNLTQQQAIPPEETVSIPTTVRVPTAAKDNQKLIGTYWSMIMVEAVGNQSNTSSAVQQFGIGLQVRYGVQIITHVGDTGAPKIIFQNPRLEHTPQGDPVLLIDLLNQGTRAARPDLQVELYNNQGLKQGDFSRANTWLYPGTSSRQRIPLDNIKTGRYTALLIANAGEDNVFGIQYTLEL